MPRWVHLRIAGFACVLALAAVGCESGQDLRYHGRRLIAEGDYRVLDMFNDGHDEYALALDQGHDDQLALLPFEGKPCRAGQAADRIAVGTDDGLRLALFATHDSPTGLRFVDAHCKSHLSPVADALDVRLVRGGFLVSTASDQLLLLDPWNDRSALISTSFTERGSFVRRPGSADDLQGRAVWLLEGDELVLRDFDGRELRRTGRHVSEIALASNSRSMIFSDDDALYALDHTGEEPERLAAPGCKLRYENALRDGQVYDLAMMLSPCDQRRLVAIDTDGTPVVIADDVVGYFRRILSTADGLAQDFTFYATQADDAAEKHYFVAPAKGEVFEFGVPISSSSILLPLGVADAWLVTTAEDETRLGVSVPSVGFIELARNVNLLARSPAGLVVLHDYVDHVGKLSLVALAADGTPALLALASGVPSDGLSNSGVLDPSEQLIADLSGLRQVDVVLHDYDGETGTLSQIEANATLLELATAVPSRALKSYETSVRGTQLISGTRNVAVLSYLYDFDAESSTGTLAVMTPEGARVVLDHDVASHVASGDWDRPGVLYAKGGSTREVWFVQQ